MFDILVEMDPGLVVSVWLILKAHLLPPQGHLCAETKEGQASPLMGPRMS